ncbi:uncharacterized protein SPAPADRAFT_58251 [Spathaspora passalidarum NRRL Y-27907]|uniref:Uncharacterized protein n=1 Tax=Spathaspora passalidarum (strain NRRL Y-27907 / 11-Y1) TaxID=619300 RepID=G3AFX1_SPAPN|nr:uncharacterized protein SPAPADRAFT_58251 [Spathaspora passalidarum NRRL Y-27907]EGW35110.1 hypothetical protein SPAPADRAFT_58251 [Spathaspora passalidarum NRRL Y-27907]
MPYGMSAAWPHGTIFIESSYITTTYVRFLIYELSFSCYFSTASSESLKIQKNVKKIDKKF